MFAATLMQHLGSMKYLYFHYEIVALYFCYKKSEKLEKFSGSLRFQIRVLGALRSVF